jgi:RimJ/RimL family protein N-acetyltransferase
VGLLDVDELLPFSPAVEIGWRLATDHQGKGFACEAASVVLEYAFKSLGLAEVVSFTSDINLRSIKLMKKLQMHSDIKDNFNHPKVQKGDRLEKHVLYRIEKEEYEAKK